MIITVTKVKQKQILQAVAENKRLDGRDLLEYREMKLEQGIIERAEGSARVLLGKTEVVVGIKVEVGEPYPDTPNDGVLTVNAELVPIASPSFEPGPPGEDSIELARIVDRGIRESKAIDTSKLCIKSGKKVLIIFVDVYVLNYDGNLIDAAALAAVAALINTKMANYELEDDEVKVKPGYNQLPMRKHPITITCAKIGEKIIIDPELEEEQIMDARLSIAFDDDDNICAMQKGGNSYFEPDEILEVVKIAMGKAKEIRKKLNW